MLRYIICISIYLLVIHSALEYGPFDLAMGGYTLCKGPKRRNCTEITIKRINHTTLQYHFIVKEDMPVVRAKVTGIMKDQELLRIYIKDVCKHIFVKPVMQVLFLAKDQCGIFKGNYLFAVDLQNFVDHFYGGKFMYGNWSAKFLLYTDFCNMQCITINLNLTPKSKHN